MISLLSPILPSVSDAPVRHTSLIPRDCIQYVIPFTDTPTTLSMFLVCRSWYHSVDRLLWLADSFYFLPEMFTPDIIGRQKVFHCVGSSVSTRRCDVRWSSISVMVLKSFDSFQGGAGCFPPKLTSVNVWDSFRLTDAGIALVSQVTTLTSLSLSGCYQITDIGISNVSQLTSLTFLNLGSCNQMTDAGVAFVSALPSLKTLVLSGFPRITDAGVVRLCVLTSLTSLSLSDCECITDVGVSKVSTLTSLTSLTLSGFTQITNMGIANLSKLTSLTSLNLGDSEQISDIGIATKLTSLT
eukprot:PhF_6_TR27374/c1_g1_i1/m.40274/K10280/FBXL14; F-box and leucine-rich repeat protein 14